jgi:hypothetical protein
LTDLEDRYERKAGRGCGRSWRSETTLAGDRTAECKVVSAAGTLSKDVDPMGNISSTSMKGLTGGAPIVEKEKMEKT